MPVVVGVLSSCALFAAASYYELTSRTKGRTGNENRTLRILKSKTEVIR